MTVYVVSGYRRSGTSMMMGALWAGLKLTKQGALVRSPDMEGMQAGFDSDGYRPNPEDLLEVGQGNYCHAPFLRALVDHDLVKILFDGLPYLPKGDWKVIFMERDEAEIVASYDRVDQYLRETVSGYEKPAPRKPFDVFVPYNQDDIDHVLGICEARSDIDLRRVQYADVIEDPVGVLESLEMPISVEAAAGAINPKHYRFRREDIERDRECGSTGVQAEGGGDEQAPQQAVS